MIYSNLKRYDSKGRRLSIFAVSKDNNKTLDVFVQICSKKDQFRKSYSREKAQFFFNNGIEKFKSEFPEDHPQIFNILVEENKPKITFLNWCRNNFQKFREEVVGLNKWEDVQCTKYFMRNGKIFKRTVC